MGVCCFHGVSGLAGLLSGVPPVPAPWVGVPSTEVSRDQDLSRGGALLSLSPRTGHPAPIKQ